MFPSNDHPNVAPTRSRCRSSPDEHITCKWNTSIVKERGPSSRPSSGRDGDVCVRVSHLEFNSAMETLVPTAQLEHETPSPIVDSARIGRATGDPAPTLLRPVWTAFSTLPLCWRCRFGSPVMTQDSLAFVFCVAASVGGDNVGE